MIATGFGKYEGEYKVNRSESFSGEISYVLDNGQSRIDVLERSGRYRFIIFGKYRRNGTLRFLPPSQKKEIKVKGERKNGILLLTDMDNNTVMEIKPTNE